MYSRNRRHKPSEKIGWKDTEVYWMFGDLAIRTYVETIERFKAAFDSGEEGQGMIEYGLLVALISIVAIGVITAIGTGLTGNFQSVKNAL